MALLLHITAPADDWLTAWHFEPLLSLLLLAVGLGYWIAFQSTRHRGRPVPTWHAVAFFTGLTCLAIALMGPPSHFNGAAFSAHMVQHLVLVQVAAPLLV